MNPDRSKVPLTGKVLVGEFRIAILPRALVHSNAVTRRTIFTRAAAAVSRQIALPIIKGWMRVVNWDNSHSQRTTPNVRLT